MERPLTPEQLERLKILFVDCCRVGKELGLGPVMLAGILRGFAGRLVDDYSPLDRYIDNPDGDNPEAKPS